MALAATAEKRATGLFCMAAFLCSVGSAAIAPEKHLLSTSFQHFSDNLYCSGSEERLCGAGGRAPHGRTGPGECMWFNGVRPVKPAEMDPADNGARAAWPRHRWDPVAAGAVSASEFPTDLRAVQRCFRGKRVHFAGDSTTRDAYTMLVAELKLAELKPNAPRMVRQRETVAAPDGTRLSFQFFATANRSEELPLGRTLNQGRAPDYFVVQCFMYDWYKVFERPASRADDAMGEARMHADMHIHIT